MLIFSINIHPAGPGQRSEMKSGFPLPTSPPFALNPDKMEIPIKFMRFWHIEEAKDKCIKSGDNPSSFTRRNALLL